MKAKIKVSVAVLLCCSAIVSGAPAKAPVPEGPYLGQKPPGMVPELFAPDMFKEEVHSAAVFSPDGRELYWNLMSGRQIMFMKMEKNRWSSPKKAPFALRGGTGDPALSPDGTRLFFTSGRRIKGLPRKENIWCVERSASGWSDPKPISAKVNSYSMHWQHSLSEDGDLYFSADHNGNRDVFRAELVDGDFPAPVRLGRAINSSYGEGCPFISPDESYLIFSRYGGDIGYADLYISFRDTDGSWQEAVNMGAPINTGGNDTCPFVTYDHKYFFYIRNDSAGNFRIYWVDAQVIEELKTKHSERKR